MSHLVQEFHFTAGDAKKIRFSVFEDEALTIPDDISAATEIIWGLAVDKNTAAFLTKTLTGGGVALVADPNNNVFDVTLLKADTVGLNGGYYWHEAAILEGGDDDTIALGEVTLFGTILG